MAKRKRVWFLVDSGGLSIHAAVHVYFLIQRAILESLDDLDRPDLTATRSGPSMALESMGRKRGYETSMWSTYATSHR